MTWWCCQQRLWISRADDESLKWWLNPECCSRQATNVQIKCKFGELNRKLSLPVRESNFVFIALWIHFENCFYTQTNQKRFNYQTADKDDFESDENNSKLLEDEIQLSKGEVNWIIIWQSWSRQSSWSAHAIVLRSSEIKTIKTSHSVFFRTFRYWKINERHPEKRL